MAAHSDNHPPVEQLRDLGLGKLPADSSSIILSHLQGCATCRQQVASLFGGGFLNRLPGARVRNVTPVPDNSLHTLAQPTRETAGRALIPGLPTELAANTRYEIQRELGRGGMGVVYLARNRQLDRIEVLKVMGQELLSLEGARLRFEREIKSAARLNHPNVVAAYSVLPLRELLVFAMEYVEGDDLAEVVKVRGALPVANACYYAYQVALGLQHAFEKQMVHRDIKPHNLIVTRTTKKHTVKILDFGLAKANCEKGQQYDLTGAGRMLGSPHYVAPEQINDAATADIRADIYSLGCTLYYLLTGGPPFTGDALWDILNAHLEQKAKPLNEVRPEVPESLEAIVRKMMAKKPAQRYQTPGEVAEELLPFVKQGTTSSETRHSIVPAANPVAAGTRQGLAESLNSLQPPGPSNPRHRRGIGALMFVVLGGLAGLWVSGALTAAKVNTTKSTLVLEANEPNANVTVDGEGVSIAWHDGGKRAEIQLNPGSHAVRVTKAGFAAYDQRVTLEDDRQQVLRATLVPKTDD
jgi:serine/threonine protein kinase